MKNVTMGSVLFLVLGCGSENSAPTPYSPGDITVIGESLGGRTLHLTACGSECDIVAEECGADAAADVILNANGEAVDVLCFEQGVAVESVGIDRVPSAVAGNNTVLVLDGSDDGLDVEGDVTISGNNAVVYGDNPSVSVIGGTLKIEKNNAIVRGVRILEDVTITKNNTQLSYCVIEGDLTITGNNTTLAECVVKGRISILGVNTVLVQNRFPQATELEGKNLTCHNNLHLDEDAEVERVADGGHVEGDAAAAPLDFAVQVPCVDSEEPPQPQSDP